MSRFFSPGLVAISMAASLLFFGPARETLHAAEPAKPAVRWVSDPAQPTRIRVEVTGLPADLLNTLASRNQTAAQWQEWLAVYADTADVLGSVTLPPMLGTYSVKAGILHFEPRFPGEPGLSYRAELKPRTPDAGFARIIVARHELPARKRIPTAVVSAIYPSAEVLPENLLKFYLHFSAPMSRGHSYEHIRLLNEAGQPVDLPFLEIDEELWNPEMTRLTLFIDPGRIKREVKPLEEIGPALETGKTYTLEIDRAWEDENGAPLKESFRKTFKVSPPDRNPLDAAKWQMEPPRAGTRDAVTLRFPKPLDHALAQRLITVQNASGKRLAGEVKLHDQERRWTFAPAQPWTAGAHRIVVQTIIEDLAGNNIGKPFEVDVFETVDRQLSTPTVTLPLEVR